MTLPNFFLVGAIKAGTSSLFRYLDQHPDVFMSPVKEPGWFADEFYGAHEHDAGQPMGSLQDYERLFDGVQRESAIGEASPHYLYSAVAPLKIRAMLPSARILVVLRDPAERAFSAYVHLRREQAEPLDTFEAALDAEPERVAEGRMPIWYYQGAGQYVEQVTRYIECFGAERVWIGLYDDFQRDSVAFTRELYRFLGVSDSFIPDTSLRFNPSGLPRSRRAFTALTTDNALRRLAAQVLPYRLREPLRVKLIGRVLVKPELAASTRRRLVDTYRSDIERLSALLDRDLSAWLR